MIVTGKFVVVNHKDHLSVDDYKKEKEKKKTVFHELAFTTWLLWERELCFSFLLTVKIKIAEGFVCLFVKKNILQMCSTSNIDEQVLQWT